MKNIFSFVIFMFAFSCFAEPNETSEISEQVNIPGFSNSARSRYVLEHRLNLVNKAITDFKNEYPQFEYGIRSMEGLYDVIENPESIYEEMKEHTCARSFIFAGEVLTGGACEVIKSLSVFHPESSGYGNALIGLYLTKSILWGIDSWLYGTDKDNSVEIINVLQTDPLLASNVAAMSSQVTQIDFVPVIQIAENVINIIKKENPSNEDLAKLKRLTTLYKKLQNSSSTKNILCVGGKIISFITGIAAGLSITFSGQDSASSYWLTLLAGGFDSIIDSVHTTITKKPITQRYITISEILFLCNYFLEKYRTDTV